MNEPLPEPQNPVFKFEQVRYALSLFDKTDTDADFIAHMEAHWDKSEENCERCLSAWKEMPWSTRMAMHDNYELENEEQD